MRPDPEDRSARYERADGWPVGRIVLSVLAVAAVAYGLLSGGESPPVADSPAPPLAVEPAPPPIVEQPPAPDIPEAVPVPEPAPQPELPAPVTPAEPPPGLDTSDAELRQRLAGGTDDPLLAGALANDNLLERGTAVVDLLSRGGLSYKLLPVALPAGKFAVAESDGQILLDPLNYQRYDDYVRMIEQLDTSMLVATFHRFRPLLEETYASLGYQAEEFDNALIRALDRILATPQLEGDVLLVKKEAIYQYADPALEQRGDLQKLLMRLGPDNLARVQNQVRALREALLAGG